MLPIIAALIVPMTLSPSPGAQADIAGKLLLPLQQAKAMTVIVNVWHGDEKGQFIPGLQLHVEAKRPGSLRVEAGLPKDWHPKAGDRLIVEEVDRFVTNGKEQVAYHSNLRNVHRERASSTLANIHTTFDLVEQLHPEVLFAISTVRSFKFVDETKLDNIPVAHYARTIQNEVDKDFGVTRSLHLYVARDTGLPVRLVTFHKRRNEKPFEDLRVEFSTWVLDPVLSSDRFIYKPPKKDQVEKTSLPPNL